MSTTSCGSFARKLENRPTTSPLLLAAPISEPMVSASREMSPPVWSSSWYWKPPKTERPWIPGGANGITSPPVIPISGPRIRPSTACSEWSLPGRSW